MPFNVTTPRRPGQVVCMRKGVRKLLGIYVGVARIFWKRLLGGLLRITYVDACIDYDKCILGSERGGIGRSGGSFAAAIFTRLVLYSSILIICVTSRGRIHNASHELRGQ